MAETPTNVRKAELQKSLRFVVMITVLNASLLLFMAARMVMLGGGPRPALSAAVLLIFSAVVGAGVVRMRNIQQELGQLG